MTTPQDIKDIVSRTYAEKITTADSCCAGESACSPAYPAADLEFIPDGAVSFGCGNPIALASLRRGETVLDLGSGAGLDCFLAAKRVGPEGSVIGVDFTPEMLERAWKNAARLKLDNVSFHHGDIEALPVEDSSVDVVVSNCVINLAPDKDAVFKEAFRVLRSGGRLMVSDIVLTRPSTDEEKADMALLTGCVSGSIPVEEYTSKIKDAGFADVQVDGEAPAQEEKFWFSAAISAGKP